MNKLIDYVVENLNDEKIKKEIKDIKKIRDDRNVGEAGVPVYLILDDLTDKEGPSIESGDSMFNLFLMICAIGYLKSIVKKNDDISSDDFSELLGLLAEKYFYFLEYNNWR